MRRNHDMPELSCTAEQSASQPSRTLDPKPWGLEGRALLLLLLRSHFECNNLLPAVLVLVRVTQKLLFLTIS